MTTIFMFSTLSKVAQVQGYTKYSSWSEALISPYLIQISKFHLNIISATTIAMTISRVVEPLEPT